MSFFFSFLIRFVLYYKSMPVKILFKFLFEKINKKQDFSSNIFNSKMKLIYSLNSSKDFFKSFGISVENWL